MGLLERVAAPRQTEARYSADLWLSDYLIPAINNGMLGPRLTTTYVGQRVAEISNTLPAYMQALRTSPPAFAAQMVRALVLSQARFVFRNRRTTATPGRIFGTRELDILERPWPNATTGELIARMEWHAGLAGNAYVLRRGGRLRVLRPDWVAILWGSQLEPESTTPGHALDAELIGYVYQNGGIHSGEGRMETLLPSDVAHWSPLPDPESPGLGMSWITPALREIQGDKAATEHKLQFFANGATPNLVVKGVPAVTKEQFDEIVDMMESKHAGVRNAYRTLYLTAGADATVVGSDMRQIDFKQTQGAGETRIALLSRVPAPLLGISEGLAGSSLNAGNFGMARRIFADSWIYPSLQDLAAALAPLVRVPSDAELWFDTSDMPILREDAKDAADIAFVKAQAIRQLWDGGADTASAIATIAPEWSNTLRHTGKLSVQLQEPGAGQTATQQNSQRSEVRKFNPNQPRDDDGKWTDGAGGVADVPGDLLKLAGKIDLAPGERLVASERVKSRGESGVPHSALLALTETPDGPSLRLGLIDDDDVRKWRGANRGGTAKFNGDDIRRLRDGLNEANELGSVEAKKYKRNFAKAERLYDELDSLDPDDPRRERVLAQIAEVEGDLPETPDADVGSGVIRGSDWGDLHYSVRLFDDGVGGKWVVDLAVIPPGSTTRPDTDDQADFDGPRMRKLIQRLDHLSGLVTSQRNRRWNHGEAVHRGHKRPA